MQHAGRCHTSREAEEKQKPSISFIDDRLVEALGAVGDTPIRLVRASWLLEQPRILTRQQLEEREGQGEAPLLSPEEAVALVRKGRRAVGVLSYREWREMRDPSLRSCRSKGCRCRI